MFKCDGDETTDMSRVQRGIVHDLHDEPHLDGRRITVRFIKTQVEDRGLDPETVAERYTLDVADVYRALTYYHDHPEEMDDVEQQRQSAIDSHSHLTTDPDDVRR
jgi:uncharacterized protein (DUF433 family)